MSLLPALNESEAKSDLGWSASNRFSPSSKTDSQSDSDFERSHSNTPLEKSKLVQHLMRRSPGSASNQMHLFNPAEDKQKIVYTTETSHGPKSSIIQQSVTSQPQQQQQKQQLIQQQQQQQQQPKQLIPQPTQSNNCFIIISNSCPSPQVVTQGLQSSQEVAVNKPGVVKSPQKVIAFGHNPATQIQNVQNVANIPTKPRQILNQAPGQIVDSSVQNTQPVQILNSQIPTVGVSHNLLGHTNNVVSPSAGSPVLTQILQQVKPSTPNIVIVTTGGQGHSSTTLLSDSQYSLSPFSPGRGGGKGKGQDRGRGRGTTSRGRKIQIPKVVTIAQSGAPQQQMGGQVASGISQVFKSFSSEGSSTPTNSVSRTPPPNILQRSSSSSTGIPASADTSQKGYNIAQLASSQTVKVAGGGELQEDMIYLIKDSTGDQIRMVWKNGQFLPLDEETDTFLPLSGIHNSSGMTRGYGRGQGQKPLQGNVTGLLMAQTRGRKRAFRGGFHHEEMNESKFTTATHTNSFKILPNGRVFLNSIKKSTFGSTQTFDEEQVDLLETKSSPKKTPVEASSLESQNTQEEESYKKDEDDKSHSVDDNITEAADDQAFVENTFAVCQFCGNNSFCLIKCDRCSRKFNDKTKRVTEDFKRAKIEAENATKTESDNPIDKKTFYGKKFEQQTQIYDSKILIMTERSTGTCGEMLSTVSGSPVSVKAIHAPRGRKVRVGRGRGRHVTFIPETVMISSDEDEPDSKSPALKLVAESSKTDSINQDSCSSSTSTGPEEERSSSPLFPITPTVKRGSSPVFPKSRRERMEDEMGNLVLKPKSGEKVEVTLLPKTIRVGSFLGAAIEPILLSEDGIYFYMESVDGSHKFCIYPYEIRQCLSHFNPMGQSMMFFLTTPECAVRIRKDLGIKPHTDPVLPAQEPYFDPQSKEEAHQLITVVLGTVNDNTKADFSKLMEHFKETQVQNPEKDDQSFYMELSEEEAYQVYEQSCKKKPAGISLSPVKNSPSTQLTDHAYFAVEEDSGCMSPPMLGFTGPVLKILTYPSPPATGGIPITNEDLFCLNEGEFLNDVIIDFYIKYLFLEKLGQKDRRRTHVFSSFFFKRLTQRNASTAAEEDACVTPAAKRHARVKTWTRHVDLFEKDFIIIPINEHSHWFLAIICFPGLQAIQYVPYLPRHYISKPSLADTSSESTSTSISISSISSESKKDTDTPSDENGIVSTQTDMETDNPEPENPIPENDSVEDKELAMDPSENPSVMSSLYMSHRARCPEIRGQILDPLPSDLEKEPLPKNYTLGQRQPCILLLDSLPGPSRARIVSILKEYLQVEWHVKKKGEYNRERIRGSVPKVPQQTNFSDCGVYVLQYVESFFEDPIQDFTIPVRGLQDWFPLERVDKKRTEIRNLILSLKEEYEASQAKGS